MDSLSSYGFVILGPVAGTPLVCVVCHDSSLLEPCPRLPLCATTPHSMHVNFRGFVPIKFHTIAMNSLPTMEQTAHKASRAKLGLLEFIIVAVILLNAGYWRLYHIDYRAMWYDEVEVVRVAQLPTITDVIRQLSSQ